MINQEAILWSLQSLASPVLDVVFVAFTLMGSEEFFMIVLGAIYWCVDKNKGYMMTVLVTGAFWMSSGIKELLHTPRPSPEVFRVLYPESASGYAFPSGHTQSAVVFWGSLARFFRSRQLLALGTVMVLMVALSRLYLAVHWPVDILGGAILGVLMLALVGPVTRLSSSWVTNVGVIPKTISAFIIPLTFVIVLPSDDNVKMAGVISGFLVGAMAENRFVRFSEAGDKGQQIRKFVLGAVLVMATRLGLKLVLGGTLLATYIRYTAIGVVGAYLAPVAFVAMGLSKRHTPTT